MFHKKYFALSGPNKTHDNGENVPRNVLRMQTATTPNRLRTRSHIRLVAGHSMDRNNPVLLDATSVDSDQPAQMRRLIYVFAERTSPKVRFLTPHFNGNLCTLIKKLANDKWTTCPFIYPRIQSMAFRANCQYKWKESTKCQSLLSKQKHLTK